MTTPTPQGISALRHPDGCAFCPAELLGLERDANGDPLCQTCPHRASLLAAKDGDPR
jgi:hypothetical protein